MSRLVLTALTALTVLCAASCGPEEPPPPFPNEPPIARAVWPQRWPVFVPVPLDAAASGDVDGRLVRISATFGDGGFEQTRADGRFEHLYAAPGTYDVRVEVEDDGALVAELIGTVVVVDEVEEPACTCALPCLGEGVCTDGGCYLSAASAPLPEGFEGAPSPDGALDCD